MQDLLTSEPSTLPRPQECPEHRPAVGDAPELSAMPTPSKAPQLEGLERSFRAPRTPRASLRVPKSPLRGVKLDALRPDASLRERALVAADREKARIKQEERARRVAELEHQRCELVREMRHVLGETIEAEAIALPADPMARPYLVLTVTVDDLLFSISDHPIAEAPEGNHRLMVSLTCPKCEDANWHAVPSLSALGSLLLQVEDGTLSDICATCLMCQGWEDDPFRDE